MIDNKEYSAMVQGLKAQNADYDCLNMDLVHGAIGLSTEAGELAMYVDDLNIIEECGDALWYTQLILAIYDKRIEPFTESFTVMDRSKAILLMAKKSSDILDIVKRAFYYGKGAAGVNHDDVQSLCNDVIHVVHHILASCGSNLAECMDKNYRKLMNKRYPNGFGESEAWNRDVDAERKELES